jgi:hypothetical protein
MLSLFLSFLTTSQNITTLYNTSQNNEYSIDRGCGNDASDIFFINSYEDINMIKDCNLINGSLFINGDYNIYSLDDLSNLEYITGYLVVYDSHALKSLKGLNNLKYIYSENPYLLNYGVTIKYNDNNDDNRTGLCFGNKINWNNLTPTNIIVSDNRVDCPNCHIECNGCFGPSRFLCQECNNYKSGDACVSECPNGTIINNNTCIESYPNETIKLNFNRLSNENKLHISWDEPFNSNGYITRYILFRDNIELVNSFYNTSGYYTDDYLSNQYTDMLEDLDTNYEYKIEYSNNIGSIMSEPQNYFMYDRIPHNIYNFDYRNLTNTSVILDWFYNKSLLLPLFEYSLDNSIYREIINFTKRNNFYSHFLQNLNVNFDYNVSLRARYNDYFIGNESTLFFTTLDNNRNNIHDIPDTVPDDEFTYWYIVLIGCLVLFGIFLYCIFCCSSSDDKINPNISSNSEENTTRVFQNPIYENDESTNGDYSFNERGGVIINSNYNYIDNNDTADTCSLEFSIPSRKITKRRSFGKINDTLQRKENLMDEIRERVPDIVPKNMLND